MATFDVETIFVGTNFGSRSIRTTEMGGEKFMSTFLLFKHKEHKIKLVQAFSNKQKQNNQN